MVVHGALSDSFLVAFLFPNYFRAIFGEGTSMPPTIAGLTVYFAEEVVPLQGRCTLAMGGPRRQSTYALAGVRHEIDDKLAVR